MKGLAWAEVEEDWIRLSYSPRVLDNTIAAFNALVQAIEDRLPEGARARVPHPGPTAEF
jgi:hypothetical protein